MPARLEPVKDASIELDKRQNVPYRVIDTCPKCHTERTCDLSGDDDYLSYPVTGQPAKVYFCCAKCDHEWQVQMVVTLIAEIVP